MSWIRRLNQTVRAMQKSGAGTLQLYVLIHNLFAILILDGLRSMRVDDCIPGKSVVGNH